MCPFQIASHRGALWMTTTPPGPQYSDPHFSLSIQIMLPMTGTEQANEVAQCTPSKRHCQGGPRALTTVSHCHSAKCALAPTMNPQALSTASVTLQKGCLLPKAPDALLP